MLHAVELFASFFIPFYFFHAGNQLRREDFAIEPLVVGILMAVVTLPLRVAILALHRRLALREPFRDGLRLGMAWLPTLVFTLLLAQILRDEFGLPGPVFGGLMVYTLVNTLIPGSVLRLPTPDLTHPHAVKVAGEDA